MYDPLKHYIAEGLVVLHSYPSPTHPERLRGRFLKMSNIELTIEKPMGPLGATELRVKHGNVWFNYEVNSDFFHEYTVEVENLAKSESIEHELRAVFENSRIEANLNDLVS